MKQTFPAADHAPSTGTLIFDIGGNKYRLIAIVNFERQYLLFETLPKRIEDDEQFDQIRSRFGELLAKRRRSAAEENLMDLLGVLIEDYDRRNALPPDDSTPAEILSFLMEHSGKKPAGLLPIFGQRSHVNEALNGKRKISAEQARKLGKMFRVKPGLFV